MNRGSRDSPQLSRSCCGIRPAPGNPFRTEAGAFSTGSLPFAPDHLIYRSIAGMHFRFPTSRYTSPIKQKYNPSHIICPRLSKDASKHEKNVNEMGSFFALLLRFFCVKRVETAAPPSSPGRAVSAARRKMRYKGCVLRKADNTLPRAVSPAKRKTRFVGCVTAKNCRTLDGCGSFFQNLQVLDPVR